jgi:hypothetical protein
MRGGPAPNMAQMFPICPAIVGGGACIAPPIHSKRTDPIGCPQEAREKTLGHTTPARAVFPKQLIESGESCALGRHAQSRGKLASRKAAKTRGRQILPDRGRGAISGAAESLLGIDCGFVTGGWGNCDRGDFPNLFVLSDTSRVPAESSPQSPLLTARHKP